MISGAACASGALLDARTSVGQLRKALNAAGVQARAYYRTPLHRQPAMLPFAQGQRVPLPVTDELARTNIALPISPVLTAAQVGEVVSALAGTALAA